eukprot:364615-Chlamydomonas_euryale.AAC.27
MAKGQTFCPWAVAAVGDARSGPKMCIPFKTRQAQGGQTAFWAQYEVSSIPHDHLPYLTISVQLAGTGA